MGNVPSIVLQLIERFDRNIEAYKTQQYNETQVRREFIDPFFEALGWDIANKSGYAQAYKDVIHEDAIKIGGYTKAPDYCFRIGPVRKFFLEAKKPSVDIKDDLHPAYQLRRYAWSAKLPLSILTDFEEFSVYDCRTRPKSTDRAATARLIYLTYKEYPDNWEKIADIFSKEAILKGSFDKFTVTTKGKRGTTTVDTEFLAEIEKWRDMLAKTIALRNRSLADSEINFAVQRTIDRILFLRMCEDRAIEDYGQLLTAKSGRAVYQRLCRLFEKADDKYNSGLFHFKPERGRTAPPDQLTLNLSIDDLPISWILGSLYYPQCPYEFSVLPAEILGNVYEQFLGKVIRLTAGHQAKIEEKPEVKKAGGVYYTPSYIVDYIVKNTIGKLLGDYDCHCEQRSDKAISTSTRHSERSEESRSSSDNRKSTIVNQKPLTPNQISKIKILDPACGSGSFLLGAYTYLLNYHRDWYVENNPSNHTKQIYQGKGGQWYLTIAKKKEILLNNIFGVDIDSQAVEVTKLSLLLKVLEGETSETVGQTYKMFHERALPDLGNNIKCGNSLIGPDFYEDKEPDSIDPESINEELQRKINAFDWHTEFPQIFNRKNPGFDAVIGNPPYLKEKNNKETFALIRESNTKKYCTGKMDLWYAFACTALDLLRSGGFHSFIATNNWITNYGASILRRKIMSESQILKFIDFADYRVFSTASIQTMIYIIEKQSVSKPYEVDYLKISKAIIQESNSVPNLLDNSIKNIWARAIIDPAREEKPFTLSRLQLGRIVQKIKNCPSRYFSSDEIGNGIDVLQDFVSKKHLPKLKHQPVKLSDGVFVLSHDERNSVVITDSDRDKIKPYFTTSEINRYLAIDSNRYWIIYADKHVREHINNYPGIKRHLTKLASIITSVYKPYGLHRPRNERFFNGPKILSIRKTRKPIFSFVEFPCYVSRSFLILKPNDWPESHAYILGLLNSKLIAFWLYHRGKKQGDQLQIDKEPLSNIPIRAIDFNNPDDKAKHDKIVKLVDRMLDLHKRLTKAKVPDEKTKIQRQINTNDSQIDSLVYGLYGLTKEEIQIVEESNQ